MWLAPELIRYSDECGPFCWIQEVASIHKGQTTLQRCGCIHFPLRFTTLIALAYVQIPDGLVGVPPVKGSSNPNWNRKDSLMAWPQVRGQPQ